MPIPLDGIGLGAAGIRSMEYGYMGYCILKRDVKIPLLEVLKVLRKLFQKFSKQGSGQSPEVLGFGTESQGLKS